MNKTLIMYFSKYGTTKKYAQWLAEELNGDIFDIHSVKPNLFDGYGTIILGSGLYAGNVKGANLLVNNYEKIKDKKLIIFTCGSADYSKTVHVNSVNEKIAKLIPANILKNIKIFCLRGGINYKELSGLHKMMLGTVKKVLEKKDADKISEEDKEFLEYFSKGEVDFTDKSSIAKIVAYCKETNNGK